MLTKNINFKKFLIKTKNFKVKKDLNLLLEKKLELLNCLKPNYKYSYSKKIFQKLKKFQNIRIIGIGGSILGTEAIYDFLKHRNYLPSIPYNEQTQHSHSHLLCV